MFDDNENEEDDAFAGLEEAPIYKKALLIWDLAHSISELARRSISNVEASLQRDVLEEYADYIIADASILAPKVAGTWAFKIYDLKMENAAIIRKAARNLSVHMTALKAYGFKEVEYCDLLKSEIEEFRILFAEWVKTFDQGNYLIDRWGLFNPPGVNYDDPDPDHEIPIHPSDFFRIFPEEEEEDFDDDFEEYPEDEFDGIDYEFLDDFDDDDEPTEDDIPD